MRALLVALVACAHPGVREQVPREHRDPLAHPDATIQRVSVIGAPPALVPKLASKVGEPIRTAPIHEDVRALWALGIASDVRVEATTVRGGVDLAFVLTPQPLVEAVTITGTGRDRPEMKRMKLLVGLALDLPRIARMAASIEHSYRRDGHLDATVRVEHRGARIHVVADLGPHVVIGAIRFPGGTAVPAPVLRAKIRGDGVNEIGGLYDPDALDAARVQLSYEYYERGFATVKIGDPVMKRRGNHLEVDVPIDEGPRFQVGEVSIVGALRILRAREVAPGQLFAPSRVRAEIARLEQRYGATVEPSTSIDLATHRVALTLHMEWPWPSDILRSLR